MRTEVGEHQIGCLIGQGKGFGFTLDEKEALESELQERISCF